MGNPRARSRSVKSKSSLVKDSRSRSAIGRQQPNTKGLSLSGIRRLIRNINYVSFEFIHLGY